MDFTVSYAIADAEWANAVAARQEHAPGSDYDRQRMPYYALLNGSVQMMAQDQVLFPSPQAESPPGWYISVLDLACQLGYLLAQGLESAQPDSVARYDQADDALQIAFTKLADRFTVTANLQHAQTLEVPDAALIAGLQQFITQLGAEIHERAPSLLEWESLAILR